MRGSGQEEERDPQSMLGLEQFVSSPDLFAAVSLKCPGLGCSPED